MRTLVYFIAFGHESLDQFKLCLLTLKYDIDILLITDQKYENKRVKVIHSKNLEIQKNADKDRHRAEMYNSFIFRKNIYKLIDITQYDWIWYMDVDMLFLGDIFHIYTTPAIYLCEEPGVLLSNEHFNKALTRDELEKYGNLKGINAGIYAVHNSYFDFFAYYDARIEEMMEYVDRVWLCEQHILNMIRIRNEKKWNIKLFNNNHIGFPAKKIQHKENMLIHFACYKFNEKLELMRDEIKRRIN